jgi:hypothetical protein
MVMRPDSKAARVGLRAIGSGVISIGVVRALHRNDVREFTDRKERKQELKRECSRMSWFSEIAHEHGTTAVATLLVGLTGPAVAVLVGRRQETSSRPSAEAGQASTEAGPVAAHILGTSNRASVFQRFYYLPEIALVAATVGGCIYLLFYIGK